MKHWFCLLVLLPLFCAQSQNYNFSRIDNTNGLSNNQIESIYKDSRGFMWFGTHDGLNKYDGYKFTLYKPELTNKFSISSNLIWKIIGDSKGNLWIGTTGKGLNYFDRTTERFISFTHNPNDENSIHCFDLTFSHHSSLCTRRCNSYLKCCK